MLEAADGNAAIAAEAARVEEDAIYSAKSHFEAHDIWAERHSWIGLPAVLFGLTAGAGLVTESYPEVAGVLSLISAGLTAVLTFFKPAERAANHRASGNWYLALRNEARRFREVEMKQRIADDQAVKRLASLAKRRDELNATAPQPPRKAFERARKGIEQGEARHAVDRGQS